ncbi:MAG: hypothetical protein NC218_09905 [Acetobacter sp.]|nr:hypothetical protein [Acetobacter sp.]
MKKIALILFIMLGSCTTHIAHLSMISNTSVRLDNINLNQNIKSNYIKGEDTKSIIIFIPLGIPNVQRAIDNALKKGKGDILINATIYTKIWWFIIGKASIYVDGIVINTKESDNE